MDIVTGTAARASHISDTISPPDALPHLHACAVEMSINGFKPKRMPNLHHTAVTALASGNGHDAVGGRVVRGAAISAACIVSRSICQPPPMNGGMSSETDSLEFFQFREWMEA
jgi:hypothetical protein